MTPQETVPDLPVDVWKSLAEMWVGESLLQGGGTECSNTCKGSFEGGHHYLYYLCHSLAPGKQQEGTQLHPSTENWIKI